MAAFPDTVSPARRARIVEGLDVVTHPKDPDLVLAMSPQALSEFLDAAFPAATRPAYGQVAEVSTGHVRMRLAPTPDMLRPGGIVSGPSLMGFADVAAYAVVLAHIGPVAMAVTNTLTISFLRACRCDTVVADARILKLGRRLASVDVRLWQVSEQRLVAQATVGYALPALVAPT